MNSFISACAVVLLATYVHGSWDRPTSVKVDRGLASEKCEYLVGIQNGEVEYLNENKKNHYGEYIKYKCDPGYRLVGSETRLCNPDTTEWDGEPPVCTYNRCPDIFSGIQYGSINVDKYKTDIGSTVQFACDSGYRLDGLPSSTCLDDLTWSSPKPKCVEDRCPAIKTFEHGKVVDYNNMRDSTIKFECDSNYKLSGSEKLTCIEGPGADPVWSSAIPTCVCADPAKCGQEGCSSVVSIPNGEFEIRSKNGRQVDSKIRYTCNLGFVFQNLTNAIEEEQIDKNDEMNKFYSIDVSCTKDGWSQPQPECKPLNCPKWEVQRNGWIENSENNYPGGTVKVRCDKQWIPDGDTAIKCMANGQWASQSSCSQFRCEHIQGIKHGYIKDYSNINNFFGGKRWKVKCDAGYKLLGRKTNKCLLDGTWEHNDMPQCVPGFTTCIASGDPHYVTYDGFPISYQGSCTYTLSSTCGKSSKEKLPEFNVEGKNFPTMEKGRNVSFTEYLNVDMYGHRFRLGPGTTLTVAHQTFKDGKKQWSDGIKYNLPYLGIPGTTKAEEGSEVRIQLRGKWLEFSNEQGFTVRLDKYNKAEITIPSTYQGMGLCGICANFDMMKDNDAVTKDGTSVERKETDDNGKEEIVYDYYKIGNSWMVAGDDKREECYVKEDNEPACKTAAESETVENMCKPIIDEKGVFAECIKRFGGVRPSVTHTNCMYDGCANQDNICGIISDFADYCSENGVSVKWREATKCQMHCGDNSVYKAKTTACPETCAFKPTKCDEPEVEGCECKEGYVLSGDKCVKRAQCGCMDDDHRYYPIGYSTINEDCTENKTCVGSGKFDTKTLPGCHMYATCGVVDDERKCVCNDGYTGDGIVECNKPEPTTTTPAPVGDTAVCVIAGDPFYTTFDKKRIEYQGKDCYLMASECGSNDWEISVENKAIGDRAYAHRFIIDIAGHSIQLEEFGKVKVDGQEKKSFTIESAGVSVMSSQNRAIFKSDKIGELWFDGRSSSGRHVAHLTLTNSTLSGKVCGLCGNWNGVASDDMMTKEGKAGTAVQVGDSWKVTRA